MRIRFNGNPIDAILIGSGDRTNPNATDVNDRFYMIRDKATVVYTKDKPTSAECADDDTVDFRCALPITNGNLFNITDNPLVTGTEEQRGTALATLKASNGWYMNLIRDGEKSLSKSLTLSGKVYFTSFTPSSVLDDINVCEPVSGIGRLYVVDLYSGDRKVIPLGSIIPDTPSTFLPPNSPPGEPDVPILLLLPPGTPPSDECNGPICPTDTFFPAPYGYQWFQEQY